MVTALTLASPVLAAPPSPPSVLSKFSATFYGFVEADFIHDSTQSFNDLAGNGTIARSGSFAANNDRMIFGQRNSRLGFKLKGPETEMIKSSGIAEMDFLGNQPQGSPSPAGSPAVSESAYFASPTFRIRHMCWPVNTGSSSDGKLSTTQTASRFRDCRGRYSRARPNSGSATCSRATP
jgi:hypothetical protein